MSKAFKEVNLHGCVSGKLEVPNIGDNGNWWIGMDDTGVAAKGEQGVPGAKGDKGDKGDKGEQGIQGAKGEDADTAELERLNGRIEEVNQSLNQLCFGIDKKVTLPYTSTEDGFLTHYIAPKINAPSVYRITNTSNQIVMSSYSGEGTNYTGMHIVKKGETYKENYITNVNFREVTFTPLFNK